MAKFSKTSKFSKTQWEEMSAVFSSMKQQGENLTFPRNYVWHGYPVGDYVETLREFRAKDMLTKEEVDFIKSMGIDMQYPERRWMYMYRRAEEYYRKYGHLFVSTTEDKELLDWINSQRKKYRGAPRKRTDRIDTLHFRHGYQKEMLEKLGMVWDVSSSFNKYYELLKRYYNEMHDTNVPFTFFIGPINLGYWAQQVRIGKIELNEPQKQQLLNLGFEWKLRACRGTSFPEQALFYYFSVWNPDAISRYKLEGIELDIYSPEKKIAIEYDGVRWHKNKLLKDNEKDSLCKKYSIKLIRIREYGLPPTSSATNYFLPQNYTLEEFDKLVEKVHFIEVGPYLIDINTRAHGFDILRNYRRLEDTAFHRHLNELKEYIKIHGNFPPMNKTHTGLYGWTLSIREIRRGTVPGILTDEWIAELDELGFDWNPYETKWENGYRHAQAYYDAHGNLDVKCKYKDPVDGFNLYNWIATQRHRGNQNMFYRGTRLTSEQVERLNKIGMRW